jgi:KUP system potassium uptake protein
MVILATLATLIASQSVISGAFSVTRQAVQLNFLPRMLIKHTSDREAGQIYLPFVNTALFIAVLLLVLYFGSSGKLANAYGIAVSGTLAIDTILFIVVMRSLWRKSVIYVGLAIVTFLAIDLTFVAANISKVEHGGWFPILIAALVFIVIHTWIKGQRIVSNERQAMEGPLQEYVENIRKISPPLTRVPGHAVYISHHPDLAPLALHATVEELHELHEKVVIVYVEITNASHVPEEERAKFDSLGYMDGISHLSLKYGFKDTVDIPLTLKKLRGLDPELDFDPEDVSYFVSLSKVVLSEKHNLLHWRKSLYSLMVRNALSPSDYYKLPIDRTVEMRTLIEL